jgi:hypothetical protein
MLIAIRDSRDSRTGIAETSADNRRPQNLAACQELSAALASALHKLICVL